MASAKKPLRVVTCDEGAPPPQKKMTLAEAIESGDYLEILRAQRRDIVKAIPEAQGAPLPALHRQLVLISKEIQALEVKAKQTADQDAEGASIEDEAWDSEAL